MTKKTPSTGNTRKEMLKTEMIELRPSTTRASKEI